MSLDLERIDGHLEMVDLLFTRYALDTLALALLNKGHRWSNFERETCEKAIKIISERIANVEASL